MTDEPSRLDRRDLLVRGGLIAGTGLAGAAGFVAARELSGDDGEATATTAQTEPTFALEPGFVNLTTFLLASHPRPVREAIERHRHGLDANAALYLREAEPAFEEEARAAAADYLGAAPEEVALTDSTTMGLGLVYGRLHLGPGDEVVTTEHDFYATHESLRLRQELDGAAVRRIRLYDEPETASVDEIVSAVTGALRPQTRALAITWVHSSSGVKLPLREIAAAVADANRGRRERERILLCVDGVHGFGVEDESPVELGADVFVSGCHKWLFGPRGTGVVWAAPHAWERLAPMIPTFDGAGYVAWLEGRAPTDVPPGRLMTPGGFHSFEHRWALTEAFGFHQEQGRSQVAQRTHRLAARLKEGLAAIPGVTVKTPAGEMLSAGLVCAELASLPARDAVDRLREEHQIVVSVTPYATEYLRFGPSIVNSEDDVDATIAALDQFV